MANPQISNLPCWDCGSSDACAYYKNDNLFFCHKCKQVLSENINEELFEAHYLNVFGNKNVKKERNSQMGVTNFQQYNKQLYEFPQKGIIAPLEDRKISKATAEKYKVETLFDTQGNKITGRAFPGFDKDNNFVGQKIKPIDPEQNQKWVGNHAACTLFGMSVFPKGGKYVTITEGEEDALACFEMLKAQDTRFDPVVVSINDGAQTAEKNCKHPANYEYLNSFENIIIAFDGDKAGRQAAEKVAQLFPFKSKILNFHEATYDEVNDQWSFKDSNDYLKSNRAKDFVNMWYKADKYVPKGVRTFRSLWDDMIKTDTNTVVSFPWPGVNALVHGMITGKMDVFKAPPKIGKTTIMSELIMHIRENSPYNCGVIFLENTAKEIGLKFCGIKMNLPIAKPGFEIDWNMVKATHDDLSKDDRIMVFDPQDERTVENVMKKIIYFVKAHDCKYLFLDHASMLAYTSEDNDERRFLDKLFADLKQMATSLDIYLGVIIHVNDDGKTRGSRAPVQLCDRLYSLERDKLSDDPIIKNTTDFIVEENRWGECGLASKLFYDQETGRMSEMDMQLVMELNNEKEKAEMFEKLKE